MKSRVLLNLFLLIFIVALALFLFNDKDNTPEIKILSAAPADSIKKIFIHHNKRDTLLTKSNQEWRLIEPIDIPANQFRVQTLLNILSAQSHAQYNTAELDLKKYGLDNENTYIVFNNIKINFGHVNPINHFRYVQINNQLHLTEDLFYPLLSSRIGSLITRELISTKKTISKLVLPENSFSRDNNSLWQAQDDISSDAIVDVIHHWQHKQAFAVHDYIARESLAEIQVYFEGETTPILFNVTDIDPWLIIARRDIGLEYHFNLEDYDILLRPGAVDLKTKENQNESLRVSPEEFMNSIQTQ